MDINKISGINGIGNISGITKNNDTVQNNGSVFKDFLNSAMGLVDNTNTLQQQADQAVVDFVSGKRDDLHNVMIAKEQAGIALQFTVAVRDKVLESYKEIMRMQV